MFAWEFLPDYKYPPYNFDPTCAAVSGKRVFKFDPNVAVAGNVPGIILYNYTFSNGRRIYFKFKLENVDADQKMTLYYNPGGNMILKNLTDGEYEADFEVPEGVDSINLYLCYLYPQKEYYNTTITIEPIGTYDGTLCFDGVDDYLINDPYTLPLLDDYTIICRREIENESDDQYYAVISKRATQGNGAFVLDCDNAVQSFGIFSQINNFTRSESIVYQTPTTYNNQPIIKGKGTDESQFLVGNLYLTDSARWFKGYIKYIALYNKSLTPLQIEREINRLEEKWQSKLESRNNVSLTS